MISLEEAVAIVERLMALEGLCAGKTAERATPGQIEKLLALARA